MLGACDTDNLILHLVYEMWDTMIEKVRSFIFRHEGKYINSDSSPFYDVIHSILIARWTKSCTSIHCMAYSLNPRYYSNELIQEATNRHVTYEDEEISMERDKCLKKLFRNDEDRK
ncbi:hypothetical protein Lal_00038537 [Lupinus albus]|nr:hypothetical protein Lal_00038537 [Lupinus albus]